LGACRSDAFPGHRVGTSATLAAIVGGLLVARFVTIDSDQLTSRKVLADARERLDAARDRRSTAWRAVLDWDADDFFRSSRVAEAIGTGQTEPLALMLVEDWEHSDDDLRPYAEQAAGEYRAARDILPSLVTQLDLDWDDFRRDNLYLPPIRYPRTWEHVYDEIQVELIAAEEERRKGARRAYGFEFDPASLGISSGTRAMISAIARTEASDFRATAARRRDGLVTAHQVAQQQVQDYEAELRRLQAAHAEIVRPDARLWWGVGIVAVFAAAGVALPLWVMAQGPKDLASVRWLFWPFAAALAALLAYIIAYLAQLTRRKQSDDRASATAESGALSAVAPVPSCGNSPRRHRLLGLLFCGSPHEGPAPLDRHDQLPAYQFLPRVADDLDGDAVALGELGRAGQPPVLAELAVPDPLLDPVRNLDVGPLVDGERRLVVTVMRGPGAFGLRCGLRGMLGEERLEPIEVELPLLHAGLQNLITLGSLATSGGNSEGHACRQGLPAGSEIGTSRAGFRERDGHVIRHRGAGFTRRTFVRNTVLPTPPRPRKPVSQLTDMRNWLRNYPPVDPSAPD
jgi:hypothetical protein